MTPNYHVVIHPDVMQAIELYFDRLEKEGPSIAGCRLQKKLEKYGCEKPENLLSLLLDTKLPMIFAESSVIGDGSDWSAEELEILGAVGISADVTIYDNGRHSQPDIHEEAFQGTLLFVPGALLRNDIGKTPSDWDALVKDGKIDQVSFNKLYETRLLPLFLHANEKSAKAERPAIITIPGIGCGQFAGPFAGAMGECLKLALISLLENHSKRLDSIIAVYFDPYCECSNERYEFSNLSFMVRPYILGNSDKPQLCRPEAYQDNGDDFRDCLLFSAVAWDHVSWPGNDYYRGSRATDDGVKAAATSSMLSMTGIEGHYDPRRFCYAPPSTYRSWEDVVLRNNIKLTSNGRLKILGSGRATKIVATDYHCLKQSIHFGATTDDQAR